MSISVLQWNMSVDEPIKNIIAFLQDHPVDIICAQELFIRRGKQASNAPEQIARALNMHVYYKTLEASDSFSEWSQVNAVFSKFPIIAGRFMWLQTPHTKGPFADQYRAVVAARIQLEDGKSLQVMSAHLSKTTDLQDTDYKITEANKLVALIESIDEPVILGVDANALPSSVTISEINQVLEHAGPEFDQPTWPTKPFKTDDFNEADLNKRIDYVFVDPRITVQSATCINAKVSDHVPIIASIAI